jgi:hypothetical protein
MQVLAVTTLGGEDMGQRLDNLTEIETKRFYLQVFAAICFSHENVSKLSDILNSRNTKYTTRLLACQIFSFKENFGSFQMLIT